jgi:FKBP-type peptidyl-prolyl cis-trans isomerase 2
MAAKKGDIVKVDYVGKFDNGEVFDDSKRHGAPLEFQLGAGEVVPGFEKAVEGMNIGEEKEVKIKPTEGYGERRKELEQKIPRKQLPADKEPKVGMMLAVPLPNGQKFPAKITEVSSESVTIDLNHPLAGKTLCFKIKLVSTEEGELSDCGGECGGCKGCH